jgi:uncharacterized protein YrrD
MRKRDNVTGKDVVSYLDGKKLSSVKDLVLGPDLQQVVALLVDEGVLLGTQRVVPLDQVISFGKDAVVISDSQAALPLDRYPAGGNGLLRADKLKGRKVYTEGGHDQGSIADLYFDEKTGRVLGYELSGGVLDNVAHGKAFLPVEDILNIGADVVMIKSEAVYALESQTGGVQGALEQARDQAGQAAADVRAQVGATGSTANEQATQAVAGRRAGMDVEADDGRILVAAGQVISPAQVEEARAAGKLDALYAAGVGAAQQAGQRAGAALQGAGNQAGQAASQAADSAATLWDRFLLKVSQWTDATGARVDEEQTKKRLADIQDAVGRPVTKVILDRQDNVILNLGDIITHEAVQRAYDAGMLDSLLANVYKGEVSFTRDEMRVAQEGAATVERAGGNAPVIAQMEQKVEQAQQTREQQAQADTAEREQRITAHEQRTAPVPGQVGAGEQAQTAPLTPSDEPAGPDGATTYRPTEYTSGNP